MTTEQHIQRIEVIEAGLSQLLNDLQTIKKEMQSERVHAEPTPDEKVAAVKAEVRLAYASRYGKRGKSKIA